MPWQMWQLRSFPSLLHGRGHEVRPLRAQLFLSVCVDAVAQKHACQAVHVSVAQKVFAKHVIAV